MRTASDLFVERNFLVHVGLEVGLVRDFCALLHLILPLDGMLPDGKQILTVLAFSSAQHRGVDTT